MTVGPAPLASSGEALSAGEVFPADRSTQAGQHPVVPTQPGTAGGDPRDELVCLGKLDQELRTSQTANPIRPGKVCRRRAHESADPGDDSGEIAGRRATRCRTTCILAACPRSRATAALTLLST
jgi:hypothetical protein